VDNVSREFLVTEISDYVLVGQDSNTTMGPDNFSLQCQPMRVGYVVLDQSGKFSR
jgi:hypothetical protein